MIGCNDVAAGAADAGGCNDGCNHQLANHVSELVAKLPPSLVTSECELPWHQLMVVDWWLANFATSAPHQRNYHRKDGARLVVEYGSAAAANRESWRRITRVIYRDAADTTRDWDWPVAGGDGGGVPPFLLRAADGSGWRHGLWD